ncbi:CGNR zinc finger domain-containing protein [Streptomyces sp. NPDC048448]|uniref:CGNR zinc finger domain-containing protein n=1 Tax=unclassified Streptomyces TaxID=2593676 RepID=UPI00143EF195|nr:MULTISPECIES: CGNR zinc finger domain-containing protein [unclassified Streptomyces]QIY63005.1 CGNR zinc finger domain-containing protein [Streptomyces sp. RPA4-2]
MNDRAPAPGGLALIQSLVNTLDLESGADRLDTAEGRAAFGLVAGGTEAARELRESLRAVCLAHADHPPHRPVTPLGELLAGAPLYLTVDGRDGGAGFAPAAPAVLSVSAALSAPATPSPAVNGSLTSRVAAAIAESLVDGTWARLKACEASTCHWAYYDRSPAGRGRWCSMSVCGARAKMRRYRAK